MSQAISGGRAVQPKRPPAGEGSPWVQVPVPAPMLRLGYPIEAWFHRWSAFLVFSAVEVATAEGAEPLGPEYHLSISVSAPAGPKRISGDDALWVLRQFDLLDAKEDNHVPHGVVRNFWRPVADHLSGYVCPCQDSEPAIVEDRGDFVWRPSPT